MINIDLKEYHYDLPADRIAQIPAGSRDSSRLLVYRKGIISERLFTDIYTEIPSGCLLVFNDTRVIRARIIFTKDSGAAIEVFLLEPVTPSDYAVSLGSKEPVEWRCLIGNLKRWKDRTIKSVFKRERSVFSLGAEKLKGEKDTYLIRFTWDNPDLTFGEVIDTAGHTPLPPYINRLDNEEDGSRYQTIYSAVRGSVAAPTAGLHFTKEVFGNLYKKGIDHVYVTLHVGAGTFQPVKSGNISNHEMHTEHFYVTRHAIEKLIKSHGNIIAVGTTSVRTIESLYWTGLKILRDPFTMPAGIFLDQWEAYSIRDDANPAESLYALLEWMKKNNLLELHVPTRLIIVPGYRFRITDGMITNFHLPGSTLLLLVSAWAGTEWKKIYDYALANNFRFLSYGDSSLLLK